MKAYRKGAQYERDFAARMEKRGFHAFRSAGSHSQIDVILIPGPHAEPLSVDYRGQSNYQLSPLIIKVCQCKRGAANTTKEKEEFRKLDFEGAVHKLWVSKKDRENEVIELII